VLAEGLGIGRGVEYVVVVVMVVADAGLDHLDVERSQARDKAGVRRARDRG
jgi:hypothetical protein